ncbi:MAG: CRISPR-associated protein Cas5 [Spirochaetales bacterium]|nr:CRISPR-associated protein Cas5 [Spirochaetales bacterium]
MFALKLWSNFGVFRDPLTITQNITFMIPPKTTIGGMLASIIGIDYEDYFNELDYFSFNYSVVLDEVNTIRKNSFSQNYVEDYTKNAEIKFNAIDDLFSKENDITEDLSNMKSLTDTKLAEYKKLDKKLSKFFNDISGKMTKPKPIFRELLINPNYLIFINNFKHEKEIIPLMKKHYSSFSLYMGNSEFPANYEFLECKEVNKEQLYEINSFTKNLDKIKFEDNRKYSTVYFATKVVGRREYRDYKKLVICNKPISFKEAIQGYHIKLSTGVYNCEFV